MSRQLIGFVAPSETSEPEPNPCVRVFGLGPEGATCKTCSHLVVRWGAGRKYYKCDLRRMSACGATDHRVGWRACGKWEAADEVGV